MTHVFYDNVRFNNAVTQRDVDWWIENLEPVGFPADLWLRLSSHVPGSRENIVDDIDPIDNSTRLEVNGSDGNQPLFWIGRSIFLNNKQLNLDVASIEPPYQGMGYGRQFAANCCKVAIELSLDRLTVTALGVGAYAWARVGFLPRQEYWQACKSKVETILPSLHGVDPVDMDTIKMALSSNRPEGIWVLSDFDATVWYRNKFGGLESITLGKALLLLSNASWKGSIELKGQNRCENQLKRVGDYLNLKLD